MMFAKYFEYYTIILRGHFLWTRCSNIFCYKTPFLFMHHKLLIIHLQQCDSQVLSLLVSYKQSSLHAHSLHIQIIQYGMI